MTNKNRRSFCPIAFALDIFGDKWSLLIIRDLMFQSKDTYGNFLESSEDISTNILADRLKRLETEGVILKSSDPNHGRRIIYSLTGKGLDLAPVLMSMVQWSGKYDPDTAAPRELLQQWEDDPNSVLTEIGLKL